MRRLFYCTVLSLLTLSAQAFATECPGGKSTLIGHIASVHYSNNDYYPTFTLNEFGSTTKGNSWMRLSKTHGIDTDYGKAMLSIFLLAKKEYLRVQLTCTDDGVVDELFILDN